MGLLVQRVWQLLLVLGIVFRFGNENHTSGLILLRNHVLQSIDVKEMVDGIRIAQAICVFTSAAQDVDVATLMIPADGCRQSVIRNNDGVV